MRSSVSRGPFPYDGELLGDDGEVLGDDESSFARRFGMRSSVSRGQSPDDGEVLGDDGGVLGDDDELSEGSLSPTSSSDCTLGVPGTLSSCSGPRTSPPTGSQSD